MNLNRFVIIHGNMNKLHIKNIYICIKKKKKKKAVINILDFRCIMLFFIFNIFLKKQK